MRENSEAREVKMFCLGESAIITLVFKESN